jgi:predicted SAM-dependent methyltransferase
MKKYRMVSPSFVKGWRPNDETDPVARALVSRCYWVGPQDHAPGRDFRRRQLFGFGLVEEEQLAASLASLEARGALVPPAQAAAELEPERAEERAQIIEAQASLAAIARLTETIAGDVGGMGCAALPATGGNLPARLAAIQDQLQAIGDELHAARAGFLEAQRTQLGLDTKRDLKLHIGAGPTRLPGWVNSDISPSELSFNLSWGIPLADDSVAFAYAGHVFEHLYYAGEALDMLREVRRVLKPGGVFRFIVPDMGLFLERYAAGDRAFFEHWRTHATKFFGFFDTPMELVMMYSQVGRAASEFFAHKMGYDFETVEKLARRAGFTTVTRSDFMASEHPELKVDSISAAANLSFEGRRYSLFVELS